MKVIDKQVEELKELIRLGKITHDEFQNYLEIQRAEKSIWDNKYIRRISGEEQLIIPACSTIQNIAESKGIFGNISKEFDDIIEPKKEEEIPEVAVNVFITTWEATWMNIFADTNNRSLALGALQRRSFTQSQIIGFAKKNRHWLFSKERMTITLFALKVNCKFFLVEVNTYRDDNYCNVNLTRQITKNKHEDDRWYPQKCRLVAPQRARNLFL